MNISVLTFLSRLCSAGAVAGESAIIHIQCKSGRFYA